MQVLKERIIVLKKVPFGESDLIIHGLSGKGARMHFVAKGALKSRKRFGGGLLEPTRYIEVQYKDRKGGEESESLYFLLEAQNIESFDGLRLDYDRLELGLFFVQLVSKVIQEGVLEEESIFNLLGHALKQAESTQRLDLLKLQFELKFLYQQGVLPPELVVPEILSCSIRDHESLIFGVRELQVLQSKVNHFLHSYVG
ncbi:MAG: DNA repair protein RecO [Bdellovibrionales bacterium]|nr:DNA repair protein RecO [Bdellovibrionales bacterium]